MIFTITKSAQIARRFRPPWWDDTSIPWACLGSELVIAGVGEPAGLDFANSGHCWKNFASLNRWQEVHAPRSVYGWALYRAVRVSWPVWSPRSPYMSPVSAIQASDSSGS